jgi:hypothetical protein
LDGKPTEELLPQRVTPLTCTHVILLPTSSGLPIQVEKQDADIECGLQQAKMTSGKHTFLCMYESEFFFTLFSHSQDGMC